MKMIGYFWVITFLRGGDPSYKLPVYDYTGGKKNHISDLTERNKEIVAAAEDMRLSGYSPQQVAVCNDGVYVRGTKGDRAKTVKL